MPDEAAFLATILERPEEDGPRLVFADWLEEQGDCERAEFIRTQIELSAGGDDARRPGLQRREAELLQRHEREWLTPLMDALAQRRVATPPRLAAGMLEVAQHFFGSAFRRFDQPTAGTNDVNELAASLVSLFSPIQFDLPIDAACRCTFRRGFVEHVELVAADFVRCAEVLFAHAPLQEITVSDGAILGSTRELFYCPALSRLRSLGLRGLLDPIGVHGLVNSPYLAQLRRLSVERVNVVGVSPRVLGEVANMPNLRELHLVSVPVGDEGVVALAGNPMWANLEVLDLSGTGVGDEGVRALAGSAHLGRLRKLDLSHNLISGLGVARLVGSSRLDNLAYLDLGHNRLADSVMQSASRFVARWMGSRELQPWLQRLLDSPLAARLETLVLDRDAVDPGDRRQVQQRLGARLQWA